MSPKTILDFRLTNADFKIENRKSAIVNEVSSQSAYCQLFLSDKISTIYK